jgi:vancomycin resistance protein VanJ
VVSLVVRLVAERAWWATLLLYVPQVWYFLPAPVVLLPALWTRHRRALFTLAGTLLLIAGPIMGFNVPLPAFLSAERGRVRVLCYNIRGGEAGHRLLEAQIDRYRPDVVVFTEASGWGHDDALHAFLERKLPGWRRLLAGEVYLASRWPVVRSDKLPLSGGLRQKGRILVEAPFGRFWVVGAHFSTALRETSMCRQRRRLPTYLRHTARVRREQAEDVLAWTRDLAEPVLFAGDLNTPPMGRIHAALAARYTDAWGERGWGWGYTYPSHMPLLRIDYIWHSWHWTTVRCDRGPAPGSDHRPVFAELGLRR